MDALNWKRHYHIVNANKWLVYADFQLRWSTKWNTLKVKFHIYMYMYISFSKTEKWFSRAKSIIYRHIFYTCHLLSCNFYWTHFTWIRFCTLLYLCNISMWATIITIGKVKCHGTFNFGCKQVNELNVIEKVTTSSWKSFLNLRSLSYLITWKINNLMVDEL